MKADAAPLTPAFANGRHAFQFTLLILFFFALPLLLLWSGGLSQEAIYASVPSAGGDFSYLYQQIYEDHSDVDVLFLGSCQTWHCINAPLIQRQLSEACGQTKKILVMAHPWRGIDLDYFLLQDLIAHKHVHLVFMQSPSDDPIWPDWPQWMSEFWFTLQDWPMLSGLPARQKLSMYAETVLGAPRHLLSKLRNDNLEKSYYKTDEQFGTCILQKGWCGENFVPLKTPPPKVPTADLLYSSHRQAFHFADKALSNYQMLFLKKCMALLEEKQIPVVFLHVPELAEPFVGQVPERLNWPKLFGQPLELFGIPPKQLFAGMNVKQAQRYFVDEYHVNANGNKYFSEAISQGVIDVYKQKILSK